MKMTMKQWEGSKADDALDKRMGYKEGSAADNAMDRKMVAQMNRSQPMVHHSVKGKITIKPAK